MALTNADRQRRWRDKRNNLAQALLGRPSEICEAILLHQASAGRRGRP